MYFQRVTSSSELLVKSRDGKEILRLGWSNGVASVEQGTDRMRRTAEQWIAEGFDEWVGELPDSRHRVTKVGDPLFLIRIKQFLESRYRFSADLRSVTRETDGLSIVATAARFEKKQPPRIDFATIPEVHWC